MRRIARHLFTLCSVVSLLAGVAVGALWHRSETWEDRLTWVEEQGDVPETFVTIRATSASGEILLHVKTYGKDAALPAWPGLPGFEHERHPRGSVWIGSTSSVFAFAQGQQRGARWLTIRLPHWAAVLALATPPAARLGVWIRRRRRVGRRSARAGLCRSCGYDLRASPDRCPECGTVPEVTT